MHDIPHLTRYHHPVTTLTSRQAWARIQARRAWTPTVNQGTVTCRRCHQPIRPGEPWDIGHPTDRPAANGNITDDLAPEHQSCNRAGLVTHEPPAFTGWPARP